MFGCNGEETVLLKVTCRAQVSKGTVQDTGQNFVDFLQITNTAIMQNWIGQFMTWMNSNREDIPIILTDFWWCPGRKEKEIILGLWMPFQQSFTKKPKKDQLLYFKSQLYPWFSIYL